MSDTCKRPSATLPTVTDHTRLVPPPEEATAPSLAEERRDVARARILRAAGTVLAARGLSATVDDVAAAAGVNRRTVFRHFATREAVLIAAIRAGIRRYADLLPAPPAEGDLSEWLREVLLVTHRLNARNGRVFWELAGVSADDLSPRFAEIAEECRTTRNRFAASVTARLWHARSGEDDPPSWLIDTVAVHLSGFTTQSLSADRHRTPDEVATVSTHTLQATFTAALR